MEMPGLEAHNRPDANLSWLKNGSIEILGFPPQYNGKMTGVFIGFRDVPACFDQKT